MTSEKVTNKINRRGPFDSKIRFPEKKLPKLIKAINVRYKNSHNQGPVS